jgi:hypothetical protein
VTSNGRAIMSADERVGARAAIDKALGLLAGLTEKE